MDRVQFHEKVHFCLKMDKIGPKWQRIRFFFSFSKNCIIIHFWIWCYIKVLIISFFPAQIPYLGRFWFLSYNPNKISLCQWECMIPIPLSTNSTKWSNTLKQFFSWFQQMLMNCLSVFDRFFGVGTNSRVKG